MKQGIAAVAVALGLAAAPASAATISLTVSGLGLDGVDTRTCGNAFCTSTIWSLASAEVYAATGTISIDTTFNTMTISLAVATSVLDADLSPPAQPVTSDGATSLVFTGGTYTTAAIPVTASVNLAGDAVYQIAAGSLGAVSFTNVVATGAGGTGGPLAISGMLVGGNCTLFAGGGGSGLCGISFGSFSPIAANQFRIPGGVAFGSYDRWVKHTFDILVVPEPAAAALLALGIGGLGLLRRRAPHD